MKAWFMQLKPREQLLLGVGGAAAAIIVFWGLIWTPLDRGAAALREGVEQKTRLLADLKRTETLPTAGGGNAPAASEQSLFLVMESTTREFGLAQAFRRTRPDTTSGGDAVTVSFQDAAFDAMLDWFITLEREHRIYVENASITAARDPGLVSGQVFLRRL